MSAAEFELVYDGAGVRPGWMNVYDLAPALLGVADLIREANRELNGERALASVSVKAHFREGSFGIGLVLDQTVVEHARALPFLASIVDPESLINIIFGSTGTAAILGIIKIFKALKGEKPKPHGITIVNGTAIIQTGSGNSIGDVDAGSAKLYGNDAIRNSVRAVLSPLSKPGLNSVEVKRGADVLDRFTKPEAEELLLSQGLGADKSFSMPKVSYRDTVLRIVRLSFKRGHKYFVSEGHSKFNVSIEDENFLGQVDRDEIEFSAHGRMEVLLRQEVIPGLTKDVVRYVVERVYAYVPPAKQMLLTGQENRVTPKRDR